MLRQLQTLTLHLSFEICKHLFLASIVWLDLIHVGFVAHFADDLVYIRLQLNELVRKLSVRVWYSVDLSFVIVYDSFDLLN